MWELLGLLLFLVASHPGLGDRDSHFLRGTVPHHCEASPRLSVPSFCLWPPDHK